MKRFPLLHDFLFFLSHCLKTVICISPTYLDWLAGKPQDSFCLCVPSTVIVDTRCGAWMLLPERLGYQSLVRSGGERMKTGQTYIRQSWGYERVSDS